MQHLARIVFKNRFVPPSPDGLMLSSQTLLGSISAGVNPTIKNTRYFASKRDCEFKCISIWNQCRDLSTTTVRRSNKAMRFPSRNPASVGHLSKVDLDDFVYSLNTPTPNTFSGLRSDICHYSTGDANETKPQKSCSKLESRRLKIEKNAAKQFFTKESVAASEFQLFNLTGKYMLDIGRSRFECAVPTRRKQKSWTPVPRFYPLQACEAETKRIHGYLANVGEGIHRRTKQLIGKLRAKGADSPSEIEEMDLENPYAGCATSSNYKALAPMPIHEAPSSQLFANIVAADPSSLGKSMSNETEYATSSNHRHKTLMQLFDRCKLISIQPVNNVMLKNWGLVDFFESHRNVNDGLNVKIVQVPVRVSIHEVLEQHGRNSIRYIGKHGDVGLILIGENSELLGVVPEHESSSKWVSHANSGANHEISSITASHVTASLLGSSVHTKRNRKGILRCSSKSFLNPANERFYSDDSRTKAINCGDVDRGLLTLAEYDGRTVQSNISSSFRKVPSSLLNEFTFPACESLPFNLLADIPGKFDTQNENDSYIESSTIPESRMSKTDSKEIDLQSMPTFTLLPFEGSAEESLGGAEKAEPNGNKGKLEGTRESEKQSYSTPEGLRFKKSDGQTKKPTINVQATSPSHTLQKTAKSISENDRVATFSQPNNNQADHPCKYPSMPIVCYPKQKHLVPDAQGRIRYPKPCPYQYGPQYKGEDAVRASIAEHETNIPPTVESHATCHTLAPFELTAATAKSDDIDFESVKTIGEGNELMETHSPDSATITSSRLCEQPYSDGHLPEHIGCDCPKTQENVGIRCCPWFSNQPCPQIPDTLDIEGIQCCPFSCDVQCPNVNNASSTEPKTEVRCCKCFWPCGHLCPRPPVDIPNWTELPDSYHAQMPPTPSYNPSYESLYYKTPGVESPIASHLPKVVPRFIPTEHITWPQLTPSQYKSASRRTGSSSWHASTTVPPNHYSLGKSSSTSPNISRSSMRGDLLPLKTFVSADSRSGLASTESSGWISDQSRLFRARAEATNNVDSSSKYFPSNIATGHSISSSFQPVSRQEMHAESFYSPTSYEPSNFSPPSTLRSSSSYYPSENLTQYFSPSSYHPSEIQPSEIHTRAHTQASYPEPEYYPSKIHKDKFSQSSYSPFDNHSSRGVTRTLPPSYLAEVAENTSTNSGYLSGYYPSNAHTGSHVPSIYPPSDVHMSGSPLSGYYQSIKPSHHQQLDTRSSSIGFRSPNNYSPRINVGTAHSDRYPSDGYSRRASIPAAEYYGSDTSIRSRPLSPFTGAHTLAADTKAFAATNASSTPGYYAPIPTDEHAPRFSLPLPEHSEGVFQPMPSQPVRSTHRSSFEPFHPASANVSTSGSCMPCIPCPYCCPNLHPYFIAQNEYFQGTIVTPPPKSMGSADAITRVEDSDTTDKQTFEGKAAAIDSEPVKSQNEENLKNCNTNTKTDGNFSSCDRTNTCPPPSSNDKYDQHFSTKGHQYEDFVESNGMDSKMENFSPSIKTSDCSVTVSAQSLEGALSTKSECRKDCESVSCSRSPSVEEYQPVPRFPRNLWKSIGPTMLYRTMESESRKAKGDVIPEMSFSDPSLFKSMFDLGISDVNKSSYSGEWIGSGEVIAAIDPATSSCIADVILPSPAETEQCIVAVKNATEVWANFQAPCRSVILREIARRISDNSEHLAKLVSLEVGKVVRDAMCEVRGVVQMFNYAAGLASVLAGNIFESERSGHIIMERFLPLGTTGVVTAFNTPFSTFGKSASISLAVGNTVLFKPAPSTALSSIAMAKIVGETFKAFGLPPAVVCVQGGSDVGQLVAEDERVDIVAFSGSQKNGHDVGMRVQHRFGKPILNIAGNNSLIVSHDANFELALDAATVGIVDFAGQKKQKISHIIVHRLLYDQFVEKLVGMLKNAKRFCGHPLDPRSMFGPLHSSKTTEEYLRVVQEIREGDGMVEVGGRCIRGNFVEPSIVTGVDVTSKLVATPVIGPLAFVFPASNLEEAVAINNSFPNRLNSSVFTKNVVDVYRLIGVNGLSGGVISINTANTGTELTVPLGGDRAAGGGRLSGSNVWQEYCRRVAVNLNFSSSLPYAHGSSCTHNDSFQIY